TRGCATGHGAKAYADRVCARRAADRIPIRVLVLASDTLAVRAFLRHWFGLLVFIHNRPCIAGTAARSQAAGRGPRLIRLAARRAPGAGGHGLCEAGASTHGARQARRSRWPSMERKLRRKTERPCESASAESKRAVARERR